MCPTNSHSSASKYQSDDNVFRWMIEASYRDMLKTTDKSHGREDECAFPPLSVPTDRYYEQLENILRTYCRPAEHATLLDAGCGVGRLALESARQGHLVVGLDNSERFVEFCNSLLQGPEEREVALPRLGTSSRPATMRRARWTESLQLRFMVGDVQSLPFADEDFTFVLSSNVLDRIASPRAAVSEMRRVLCSGGLAVVASPLDWQIAYTPDCSCWVETLESLFLSPNWKLHARIPNVEYSLRICDRFREDYRCEVLVIERM